MSTPFESRYAARDEEDREKIRAEMFKILAETSKINAEARWYPFVASAGFYAAAFALLKLTEVFG
ncbi:hypothetical protein KPL74_02875 [Bacillus sp. NP157]|nr:hypothetical protein KPL74_02875 [Bacillus sp. NP157]